MKKIKVRPSDFAFKFDNCPRCWWMSLKGLSLKGDDLPAIFKHVDESMKSGISIEVLNRLGIPAKEFVPMGFLLSQPIPFEHLGVELVISGRKDQVVRLADGTLAPIDYKMTLPKTETVTKYARQLHGYLTAIENPATGEAHDVSALYLVCFNAYSGRFTVGASNGGEIPCAQKGTLVKLEVGIDRAGFTVQLEKIATIAASDQPPEAGSGCALCHHIFDALRHERDLAEGANRKTNV